VKSAAEGPEWFKYSFFFVFFFLLLTLVFCTIIFTLLKLAYTAGGLLDILKVWFKPQLDAVSAVLKVQLGKLGLGV
jgi:hypothetical protein